MKDRAHDWAEMRLKHLVRSNPTKAEVRGGDGSVLVSFLPMEAVGEYGGLDLSRERPISAVLNGYTYFRDGDVLVAKITPCFENGKGALARDLTSGIGFGTTELHVLRPERIEPRFLFYVTISHRFRRLGKATMYGAGGQKRISEEFVEEYRLHLPPLPTQRAIAFFLDRETEKIDTLIEKKRRLLDLLEEKRTALITRAVTRGLDPDVPMKDSGVEWIGRIPEHWELIPLGLLCERITYGFTNPMPTSIGADDPVMLTANDIGDGEARYSSARRTTREAFREDLTDKSRPQVDDVLLTKDGTLGRVALHDGRQACINQSVALIRVSSHRLLPRFLVTALRGRSYQDRMVFEAGGTTIKHIYVSRLSKMPLVVPPIGGQRKIVAHVSHAEADLGLLIDKVTHALSLIQEYRTALISAAVTGKIDVRDKVPA